MKREKRTARHGNAAFTLIELLIVVAIIAILAAIAVPNFLEAQVRSKVSRVKTDMRSIATAIESYSVDCNRPPIGNREANKIGLFAGAGLSTSEQIIMLWSTLTTPISYMTSIPKDPFHQQGSDIDIGQYYKYQSIRPEIFDDLVNLGYTWSLHSQGPRNAVNGPSGKNNAPFRILAGTNPDGGPGLFIYDPSNGTVSYGLILRTNKGIYSTPRS